MQLIFRILLALVTPTSSAEAAGLHRFAPEEVTVENAYVHVWAARVAATRYSVDMYMVLAVSYHESRFQIDVVTPAPGGRVACGVMTPYPTIRCNQKTLLEQYFDGTRHWAVDWRGARGVRNEKEALLGYAGGYLLIRHCRQGPVLRYKTHGDDLCRTPNVFNSLREHIHTALQPSRSS